MSLLLAFAAASAVQASGPQPRGLSLREAQTLPAPALTDRALGAVGRLYTEVARPDPRIRRGTGFEIVFATAPRSAEYAGVCEAETITVHFGPASDGPVTTPAYVQAVYRGRLYRIVGETAPRPGQDDGYWRMLRARCAALGPVLSGPSHVAAGFFRGAHYIAGGEFLGAHAYFSARVLAKASSMATSGTLPTVECRDDMARPDDRICDDPSRLMRNLPMERFVGFSIDRCAPNRPDLCVTATFSRATGPGGIGIEMRTGLDDVLYPPPDIALAGIRIRASTPIP